VPDSHVDKPWKTQKRSRFPQLTPNRLDNSKRRVTHSHLEKSPLKSAPILRTYPQCLLFLWVILSLKAQNLKEYFLSEIDVKLNTQKFNLNIPNFSLDMGSTLAPLTDCFGFMLFTRDDYLQSTLIPDISSNPLICDKKVIIPLLPEYPIQHKTHDTASATLDPSFVVCETGGVLKPDHQGTNDKTRRSPSSCTDRVLLANNFSPVFGQ